MHHQSKLANGTTLITIPVKGTKAVTVLAMFPVGSRYENKKLSGASHFVEHMLFKGTKKRPTYLEISRELDAHGAQYNAFTAKDYTGYYVKIHSNKLETAFDLLSDMIFHSVIDEKEVSREKGVIVEELRMYEDNPTMAIDLLADKTTFGDHPLGWDVGGTAQTVRGISREALWRYYRQQYLPRHMVLVVAGNFDQKRLKKVLPYFEQENVSAAAAVNFKKDYKPFNWTLTLPVQRRVGVITRVLDQAQVTVAFPGLRYDHRNRYAVSVLLNILGGGMSSRLFVEVREKRGLAYMIHTDSDSFRDVGTVSIQAGLDPSRLGDALQVIYHELEKIQREPVSAKELKDAQNNIAGRLSLSMEDSSNQAQWFAKQSLFFPSIETPEQMIEKIKRVTVDDVQAMAKQLFHPRLMHVAVIGPLRKEKVLTMARSLV